MIYELGFVVSTYRKLQFLGRRPVSILFPALFPGSAEGPLFRGLIGRGELARLSKNGRAEDSYYRRGTREEEFGTNVSHSMCSS
jgi:hypothetical protein